MRSSSGCGMRCRTEHDRARRQARVPASGWWLDAPAESTRAILATYLATPRRCAAHDALLHPQLERAAVRVSHRSIDGVRGLVHGDPALRPRRAGVLGAGPVRWNALHSVGGADHTPPSGSLLALGARGPSAESRLLGASTSQRLVAAWVDIPTGVPVDVATSEVPPVDGVAANAVVAAATFPGVTSRKRPRPGTYFLQPNGSSEFLSRAGETPALEFLTLRGNLP